MKTRNLRAGLAILTGGLSFVGGASAIDLIQNGGFEAITGGTAVTNGRRNGTQAGWTGTLGSYKHSTSYFSGSPVPSGEGPSTYFSWMQASAANAWTSFVTPTNETDHLQYNLKFAATHTAALTNALTGAAIDAGLGQYTFSSWMASYGNPSSNPEQPYIVLRFFDDPVTTQIGSNIIFDRATNTLASVDADGIPGSSLPADLRTDHRWIKYVATGTVPVGARKARVYMTRSPKTSLTNLPDTYADLVKLDVININDTTVLNSASPSAGETNVAPDVVLNVTLLDINTAVNTGTIQFSFDGSTVTPNIQKVGTLTTVKYDPPGILKPLSAHTYKIVWSDNGGTVTTKTNQFAFTVKPYVNLVTGPPIYLETFDGVTEGSLPAGWSVNNTSDTDIPGADLNNFHSDSYKDWVVISRGTLANLNTVTPGGDDYYGTTNVVTGQFVNDTLVTNLISTNFIFAASGDRFGVEVQYLFTGDYDLTSRTNVYLCFNNVYVQNQENIAAVEYSTNSGSTWLPALYLLDAPDIKLTGSGNIDASNTMATVYADVPVPGNYGAFIGVAQSEWAGLAPYITTRGNDDQNGSKIVEAVRLPLADNQSAVRLRFVYAAANSWYFGMDDVGLYSITVTNPPIITTPPTSQTVAVGNNAAFLVNSIGVGPLAYQWRHYGTNIPGNTSPVLTIPVVRPGDAGDYEVVVSNPSGSVTSSPPATLTVVSPLVFVTGQWDFNSNILATCGQDLQYFNATVANDTTFNTTTVFGISDINGQPAMIMHMVPSGGGWGGYKMFHGAAPNGGGAFVNQYTMVFDIYYPSSSSGTWGCFLQTSTGNGNDGDFFVRPDGLGGGLGISSVYNGVVSLDTWHRIAFAFDLAGPGTFPVLTKFIDGVKVGHQTTGLSAKDGRFALDPFALLFGDESGDIREAYVSSVQFSNGRRSDEFLASLGGPTASKVPGCIKSSLEGGNIVIRWTGDVPLEGADEITGPWSTVSMSSPHIVAVASSGTKKFYRPKIP